MPASMDAFDLVRQLKARLNAILDALPPDSLAEYREIETTIRHLDGLIYENGKFLRIPLTPQIIRLLKLAEKPTPKPGRIPLPQRRLALHEYLRAHGPASRGQILEQTQIPPGTLPALLNEDGVERTEQGLWNVKS